MGLEEKRFRLHLISPKETLKFGLRNLVRSDSLGFGSNSVLDHLLWIQENKFSILNAVKKINKLINKTGS